MLETAGYLPHLAPGERSCSFFSFRPARRDVPYLTPGHCLDAFENHLGVDPQNVPVQRSNAPERLVDEAVDRRAGEALSVELAQDVAATFRPQIQLDVAPWLQDWPLSP